MAHYLLRSYHAPSGFFYHDVYVFEAGCTEVSGSVGTIEGDLHGRSKHSQDGRLNRIEGSHRPPTGWLLRQGCRKTVREGNPEHGGRPGPGAQDLCFQRRERHSDPHYGQSVFRRGPRPTERDGKDGADEDCPYPKGK